MNDDMLMHRIRAHRHAPDVYDPPTYEEMAERILLLEEMVKQYKLHAAATARLPANMQRNVMEHLRNTGELEREIREMSASPKPVDPLSGWTPDWVRSHPNTVCERAACASARIEKLEADLEAARQERRT